MELSFTEQPFDDLAVGRDDIAGLYQHDIAFPEACRRHRLMLRCPLGPGQALGLEIRRALRSEAAWALPRPSAIASAKFAKSTVNQSHSVTPKMKPAEASPRPLQPRQPVPRADW